MTLTSCPDDDTTGTAEEAAVSTANPDHSDTTGTAEEAAVPTANPDHSDTTGTAEEAAVPTANPDHSDTNPEEMSDFSDAESSDEENNATATPDDIQYYSTDSSEFN